MHELSITQGIVEVCEQNAGGRKVLSVTLELGALSAVVAEAVEFCFGACTEGTLLEGARLDVVHIPARGRCRDCGAETTPRAYYDPCPACGSSHITMLSGEELRVREMEVE